MGDVSTEERVRLGRKFPIVVVEYNPRWVEFYEEEARLLGSLFGPDLIVRIEHFGSTSVPGLAAKPTIDILVEVTSFEAAKTGIVPVLQKLGYPYNWQSDPAPGHMLFYKGYFPETPVKYHLHMAPAGHAEMDCLLFRNYLRSHPDAAQRYADLKHHLAGLYCHNREAYTDAKGEFVREITENAKRV